MEERFLWTGVKEESVLPWDVVVLSMGSQLVSMVGVSGVLNAVPVGGLVGDVFMMIGREDGSVFRSVISTGRPQ